jgi:hypothetical protein
LPLGSGREGAAAKKAVEFFTVELAWLADGHVFVCLTATTVDNEEPQLLNQELLTDRVPTMEQALALVADRVRAASNQ